MELDPSILGYQQLAGLLLLIILIVVSFFEVKGLVKWIISILLVSFIIVHYMITLYISQYVELRVYPLFIVESTVKGSAFYLDYGQLSFISILIAWRKEIKLLIEKRLRHKPLESLDVEVRENSQQEYNVDQ